MTDDTPRTTHFGADTIPEDEYVEGAFAWIADAPVTSESVDLPENSLKIVPDGAATLITFTSGSTARTARITAPVTSQTRSTALLTIGEERYIFLQWERGSCQYMFTLLKLTATGMEEAASNLYGCEY